MKKSQLRQIIKEEISKILEEDKDVTLADILKDKPNLDHLKTNDRIRLKLIDGPFLEKNPTWKDKQLKFLFYDAREKMVGIELIGKGLSSSAFPKELKIDTGATNTI